ncbi:Gfo/Idh/MocA family oxidoreductase [Frankia sp. CNm7]|uniref:Gfo/Idh/MocA family oxidoreductase n=1 Tax=Frankia nepalensis TaxID=1836974 RepID=A0A937REV5_9ACTN|nr:Gfo/Idh/MocA family oxidoreductase [Frankia nepalensis]MBL7499703.1 Gfo/Idh/MocA family oxidoreductase [Frankia nepalensis]MBL7515005.1 Gfo/Idh/MocA family oxidoreductase [Frankia nepalensis]MBL7521311.1 Gfo/Idh/MocA family oxidoreductase [Frankia nepalensis]MBL7629135.1 Gfo/Idh/MocA family oxidoreductase [Frankia nepalensis]
MTERQRLGVGMVGYAFMGAAHSQAWRSVNRFFDLPLEVDLAAVCGRDQEKVAAAAVKLGWRTHETDWKALLARDDVDLVDICTPGSSHAEIALAALAAGKHVLCEKPLANTVEEARAMAEAARRAEAAGVRSAVGFNYRRIPAATFARDLVAAGRLGTLRHVRAVYLQDWLVDPEFPLAWRLRREIAGSGALGDIGAHIIDLTQFISGQRISGVCALTETFVRERPLPAASGLSATGLSATGLPATGLTTARQAATGQAGATGAVTVDDAALFLARLDGGALASYEASRFALGRKNGLRVELNGSEGSLVFDLERLNELEFYDGQADGDVAGFTRVLVTEPSHPYLDAWWPPGHGLGYEHSFTHEIRDLVAAIADGTPPAPSFADGLQVQLVLDAVDRSAADGSRWTLVES